MPKLADGMVDIQSLFMLLAVQVVAAIMDAEVDRLCGDGANNRNGNRGRLVTCVDMLNLRVPQLWTGRLLPRGRPRAPPVRRPRARRGGGRDVHYQQSTAREGSSADSRLQDAPESSGEGPARYA